jgi:hypothetical protein
VAADPPDQETLPASTDDQQPDWDRLIGRTGAVRQWVLDWEQWRFTPAATAAAGQWRAGHECLAGCATVDEIVAACGRDREVPQDLADARLVVMVTEATRGDRAAARVVLQRVLPGLVSQAARRAAQLHRPFNELLHDLAASAWMVIVGYPVRRRPVKVAVNIVRDADYNLFGYTPVAERRVRIVPVEPGTAIRLAEAQAQLDGRPVHSPPLACVELVEFLAYAVTRGFPHADAQLLAELFGLGLPLDEVARRHGVAPRTARRYRLHALRRLTAWVAMEFAGRSDTPPSSPPVPRSAPEAA